MTTTTFALICFATGALVAAAVDVYRLRREATQLRAELLETRAALSQRNQMHEALAVRVATAEEQWRKWELRASRFIDQIGIAGGIIPSPAMTEPSPAPRDAVQGIMSALNVQEINRPAATKSVQAVDDRAAAAAVAAVLHL